MTELFCNGSAMRGGPLHHTVSAYPFLGAARTAPRYRFFSVRDEFPGLTPGDPGGSVLGELYDVPLENIRTDFLPSEPDELELSVVELDDGRSVLAVALRPQWRPDGDRLPDGLVEITEHGSWRRHRDLPDPS